MSLQAKLDILQGTLDLMVLRTLSTLGSLHGYGIARRIEQVSADRIILNQGTIYTSLVRLEQRIGRVDRIGSLAERLRRPVVVFEPYLAGAQDEKQYRVVKDRDRWFNVVMGAPMELDEATTDRAAERVPFPDALASRLALDLSVSTPSGASE